MKFVEDKMLVASQLPKRTIALVLAGGRGTRLQQLTDNRAKPAVYFDRYEKDQLDMDVQDALGGLVAIAAEVADIAGFTGMTEPTVVT